MEGYRAGHVIGVAAFTPWAAGMKKKVDAKK